MQYVGSKNKLAKELVPIIQSYITSETKGYLEPFVGGANMIDKIVHSNRIGCDIHEELIELLNYSKVNYNSLPTTISEEEYNKVRDNKSSYPKWYVGLVGFCGSFSAKYFGGFARGNDSRDRQREAISNLKKQSPNLSSIKFHHKSFQQLPTDKIKNYVIYCDIPYKGTLEYKNNKFPYEEFYDWAIELGKNNVVLISEYYMPEDKFECIWEKETKVLIHTNRIKLDNNNNRTEKLFIIKK